MSPVVSHPIFARVFARLVAMDDRSGMAEHRAEMLAGLSGRVVEVGAGTGANFTHYPDTVTEVLAVEPEPFLRHKAVESARAVGLEVEVVDGIAHDLPVADGWADAAVASLVLCSIDDPTQALREMCRAVRPGGELRFYEHVRSGSPGAARWQQRVDVAWPHLFGGCHTSRNIAAAIEAAGWRIEHQRNFEFRPGRLPNPISPHVIGSAVKAV